MASDLGFTYTELREMPLPELAVIEKEVNLIVEARKREAARIRASIPRR